MIFSETAFWQRPLLYLPVFAMGVWLSSSNGCAKNTDMASTDLSQFGQMRQSQLRMVSRREPTVVHMPVQETALLKVDGSRPALKRASDLLRKAADTLGTNEHQAVVLIRQALGILKREGISGLDALDYDRVSAPSGL